MPGGLLGMFLCMSGGIVMFPRPRGHIWSMQEYWECIGVIITTFKTGFGAISAKTALLVQVNWNFKVGYREKFYSLYEHTGCNLQACYTLEDCTRSVTIGYTTFLCSPLWSFNLTCTSKAVLAEIAPNHVLEPAERSQLSYWNQQLVSKRPTSLGRALSVWPGWRGGTRCWPTPLRERPERRTWYNHFSTISHCYSTVRASTWRSLPGKVKSVCC